MIEKTTVLAPFNNGTDYQSQEVVNASCGKDEKKGQIPKKDKVTVCGPPIPGANTQGKNTQLPIDVQDATRDGDSEMLGGEDPKVPVDKQEAPGVIDEKVPEVGNPEGPSLPDNAPPKPEEIEVPNPRKGPNPPDPNLNDTPPGPDPNDTPPGPDPNDTPPSPDPNLNPP